MNTEPVSLLIRCKERLSENVTLPCFFFWFSGKLKKTMCVFWFDILPSRQLLGPYIEKINLQIIHLSDFTNGCLLICFHPEWFFMYKDRCFLCIFLQLMDDKNMHFSRHKARLFRLFGAGQYCTLSRIISRRFPLLKGRVGAITISDITIRGLGKQVKHWKLPFSKGPGYVTSQFLMVARVQTQKQLKEEISYRGSAPGD